MSTAVATIETQVTQQVGPLVNWREKLDVIKKTVAKDATDAQLEMFIHLANRYQLDPFVREIYYSPQIGIITSRDGYLKVAQRDLNYDGIVSCAVHENDEFEMQPVECQVRHVFAAADRGAVIGAYAICFHKSRRPAICYATLSEYKKQGAVWSAYTSAMICKVAEVLALKRQFAISGLVTEEEIGHGDPATPQARNVTPTAQGASAAPKTRSTRTTPNQDAEREAVKVRLEELLHGYEAIGRADQYDAIVESIGQPENLTQAKALAAALEKGLAELMAASQMPQPVQQA